jgi:HEAT repeat protein
MFCAVAACGLMFGLIAAQSAPPPESGVDKAWSILDAGAKEKSIEKRGQAIGALGLLPGQRRAETMAEAALKDPMSEVRTAAAHSLGEMEARGSIPALKNTLDDSDPGVVLAAAQALRIMNDPVAFDVSYEVLTGARKSTSGIAGERKVLHDPKKMTQLGIDAGVGFIPFGGLGWGAFKYFTKDDVSPIRASAAIVLAKDPDEESGKALADATDDKKWLVQVAALRALALRGDKKYLETVSSKMTADRPIVSYTAAAAVIRLSGKPAAHNAPAKSVPKKNP